VIPPWQGWDEAVFRLIHLAWRHPELDPFFRFLTSPGTAAIPAALLLIGALHLRGRRGWIGALVLALTITVADQTSAKILKPAFHRARPSVALADAAPLFGRKGSDSFPSVHATNSFAAALVLDAVFPGGRVAFFLVAGLVSYSRVYVGDHWPSDVLAGAILGSCVGWFGRWGYRRATARFAPVRRDAGTPSDVP
jgi:undecaprenyl-diphosphatase